ncbi:MAG: SRPBCC family protein [Candidatus Hydrogenedentes bacterium]|nr:SRPBCC family protein [Candidatus Hydrogenedentota bacterium]
MRVLNVHSREIAAPAAAIGMLLDSLSSREDQLWPHEDWPRMRFDRPLGAGAIGGHGPIRYTVESYVLGTSIRFRFTAPRGFDGWHGFDLDVAPGRPPQLRHTLEMRTTGWASVTWPLLFRPLHDALLEDCLYKAEIACCGDGQRPRWGLRVRILRWLLRRKRG